MFMNDPLHGLVADRASYRRQTWADVDFLARVMPSVGTVGLLKYVPGNLCVAGAASESMFSSGPSKCDKIVGV